MKCKEAQRLALTWWKTHDPADKQAYLEHRKHCTMCRIEFIRECKRMEQGLSDYNDEVIGL